MQQNLTYLDQLQEPCWMPQKGTHYLAVETNFTASAISPVKRKSQLLCFVGKHLIKFSFAKNDTMKWFGLFLPQTAQGTKFQQQDVFQLL